MWLYILIAIWVAGIIWLGYCLYTAPEINYSDEGKKDDLILKEGEQK